MIATQTIEPKAKSTSDCRRLRCSSRHRWLDRRSEGAVVKGKIVAIEKDLAVIDVGLKTEGRVPLKEFGSSVQSPTIYVGDEVEVYVERIENAAGEAVLSREKARREDSWIGLSRISMQARRSKASSSIASRAASPSISTARSPSCPAARSISGRSAMSRRS